MEKFDHSSKITVIGIGGVGGFVGGMLAEHFENVTFVARGGRRKSILDNGLVLHSNYRGERIVHPARVVESARELEVQDYVFICVKNYSLEEVCKDLGGCVNEHTVIIPVMNGADPGERVRAYVGKGQVLDSLIYITAFANEDFSVSQKGQYADIYVGVSNATEEQKEQAEKVSAILVEAEIDGHASEDIQREIWKKYLFNCAYNVETAAYNNNLGELRADPIKVEEFKGLLLEAYAIAKAKKIAVTQTDVEGLLHRFTSELADSSTSSLQRDVVAGRPTELDTFCGYLIRCAEQFEIQIPVTYKMYELLKQKVK